MSPGPELKLQRQRMAVIGAVAGTVVMFIVVDIFSELFNIALGAGVGAILGVVAWAQFMGVRRRRHAESLQGLSKADLAEQANQLQVPGSSSMTKSELADAIVTETDSTDATGEVLIGTVGAVAHKLSQEAGQIKRRALRHQRDRAPK